MRVLLVDGFGNGTVDDISAESTQVILHLPLGGKLIFVKTGEEPHEGMPIFRLIWRQKTTTAPIRHINSKLSPDVERRTR